MMVPKPDETEGRLMDFFCPQTGRPIAWAFSYVPRSLYCQDCRREHSSTEQSNGRDIDKWLDMRRPE